MALFLKNNVRNVTFISIIILLNLSFMATSGRHCFFEKTLYFIDVTGFVTVSLCHVINVFFRKNSLPIFCVELRFKYANDVAKS